MNISLDRSFTIFFPKISFDFTSYFTLYLYLHYLSSFCFLPVGPLFSLLTERKTYKRPQNEHQILFIRPFVLYVDSRDFINLYFEFLHTVLIFPPLFSLFESIRSQYYLL